MPTTPTTALEATMPALVTLLTFTATVPFAADAADAAAKVERYLPGTCRLTGRVECRSARHMLWAVEVEALEGTDVDGLWVQLTSYGITPGDELGSVWQTVPGVGRFA